jgi:hypothetical protein
MILPIAVDTKYKEPVLRWSLFAHLLPKLTTGNKSAAVRQGRLDLFETKKSRDDTTTFLAARKYEAEQKSEKRVVICCAQKNNSPGAADSCSPPHQRRQHHQNLKDLLQDHCITKYLEDPSFFKKRPGKGSPVNIRGKHVSKPAAS